MGLEDLASQATTVLETVIPTKIDPKEELLEAGFSDTTIDSLGEDLLARFEASLPIYARGVEGNLALREVATFSALDTASEDNTALKAAIEVFITEHPAEDSPSLIDVAGQTVVGLTEVVQETTEQLIEQAESAGKSQFDKILGDSFVGKIISFFGGDDWLWNTLKESASGTGSKILIGILSFFLPKGAMDTITSLQEKIEGIQNGETPPSSTDAPNRTSLPTVEPVTSENIGDEIEINEGKQGAAITGGYIIMSYMSGKQIEKNPNTLGIYEKIGSLNYNEILGKYKDLKFEDGSIKAGEIKRLFGIEGDIDDVEYYNIIEGIVGPYNTSFLNSILKPQKNLQDIIHDENGNFSTAALTIFSSEDLEKINVSEYQDLRLDEISRLIVLYCKRFYNTSTSYLKGGVQDTSQGIRNFIFGSEIQEQVASITESTTESPLYPESVSLVFEKILTGDDEINKNTHNLTIGRGFENLSPTEIEQIDALVQFRNQVSEVIPREFSLGISGFEGRFSNVMNYGSIISLYLLLGGKDLSERTEMDNIIIYTWIYNLFDGANQGIYESAALDSISNTSDTLSKDEKNILTVVLFRVLEGNRNGIIDSAARGLSLGHGVVKDQILGELDISDNSKDYLAYAIEVGGAAALWRILSLFPTTRAVLFVTGGVTIGATLILSQEAVYQELSSEIREEFDTFLQLSFQKEGETLSPEEIRKGIENGETGPSDLFSLLNATIESSLDS